MRVMSRAAAASQDDADVRRPRMTGGRVNRRVTDIPGGITTAATFAATGSLVYTRFH